MSEAMRFFRQNMYLTSPYGMMPAGTTTSVAGLTRNDLAEFHRRYVNPQNMVLAVFGDIEPAEAEALARENFGAFRGEGAFRAPNPALEPTLSGPRVLLKVNKKEGAVVFIGAPGVQMTAAEDRAVIDVIDTVMSGYGYPGGWLHSDLRGRQLVYEVHAMSVPGVEPGHFFAYARCQPDKVKIVAEAILYQVYRMALYGPTPQELELAKQMIVTSEKLENQTSASQAMSAAINELYGLGYDFDEKQLERIQRVTIDDMKRAARRYFSSYVLTVTARDEHIADGVTPKPVIVK
jgi:zinc protease